MKSKSAATASSSANVPLIELPCRNQVTDHRNMAVSMIVNLRDAALSTNAQHSNNFRSLYHLYHRNHSHELCRKLPFEFLAPKTQRTHC